MENVRNLQDQKLSTLMLYFEQHLRSGILWQSGTRPKAVIEASHQTDTWVPWNISDHCEPLSLRDEGYSRQTMFGI